MPPDAQSRLAFFSVPTRLAALYKAHIYPIAEKYGFSPVMAADVIAPGDNIMAKVYALLERAALVVADVGTPNTAFEVGMVLSMDGAKKPLILIAEDIATVPIDLKGHLVLRRPALEEDPSPFVAQLERAFENAFSGIARSLEDEPSRLLGKKEFRAAVIAVFSALEHEMRQMMDGTSPEPFAARGSLNKLLEHARINSPESAPLFDAVRKHVLVRNNIAHTKGQVSGAVARTIVSDVTGLIRLLRDLNAVRRL